MDDYFDDYFEDFEQDVESGQASHKQSAKNITPKASVKDVKRKPVKKPTMLGSSPKDRLLSSKDHELREMQNKLTATLRRLQEVDKENRTLRRLQIRQEKELSRISTQEGELPTILHKHNREVRSLKHQLRESQLNNSELNKKRSEMSDELWRANERKKKLESLCRRKDLIEREHLMMELQDTNETMRERQHRIQELEKAMELIHKTHSQEVKGLLTRQKQLQLSLTSANNDMLQFRQQLKEKERLLDVTNIYTQRVPPTSLPPPLPLMDDRGTQTPLTRPPQEGEAVLITKRHTDTTSCQTDANWTTPKRVHTEGNPPPHSALPTILPAAKPAPVMTTGPTSGPLPFATNSTNTSIVTSLPTHSVPAGNQATPTPQSVMAPPTTRLPHVSPTVVGVTMGTVATPTLPEEDEPIMKLNNQPMPGLTPPTLQSSQGQSYGTGQATPTITSLATTTIVSQATPTIVSKATPKNTANEAPKGSLGTKEKDDLLKKLFNNQYSSTSRNATPTKPIDNKTGLSFGGLSGRHDNNRERGVANESSRRSTNRESEVFGGDNSLITGLGVTRGRGLSEDIGGGATLLSSPLGSMFEQGGVASIVTNDDRKQHSSKRNKSIISQLFDTPKTEAPPKEVGVAVKRDEDEGRGHKGRGSVTSVLSQSERIRNMHQGLPSMASEDNRYGTRNGGRGKSGDTSGGVAGMTTIHGRRAGGEGGTTTNGGGLIFGDNQRTPSIFADGNVTSDTNNLFSGRGTDRADNRVGGTYPWETQVELRPQQTSTNKFQVDDDLEELTIT